MSHAHEDSRAHGELLDRPDEPDLEETLRERRAPRSMKKLRPPPRR